ncbi:unnamed protein product [Symbiodinium natans]|uniref:RING-type domain-containing protein n=1 Tax=Symbiodinium natans TaxID=878477 RepID=A0A812IM07_9DINO|nr:unnamed protein product [Symbiodinium natans]
MTNRYPPFPPLPIISQTTRGGTSGVGETQNGLAKQSDCSHTVPLAQPSLRASAAGTRNAQLRSPTPQRTLRVLGSAGPIARNSATNVKTVGPRPFQYRRTLAKCDKANAQVACEASITLLPASPAKQNRAVGDRHVRDRAASLACPGRKTWKKTGKKGDLLLSQRALEDRASCVERGLLASWVRGAALGRPLVLVMRVTMPGCWGPPRIMLLRVRPTAKSAPAWQKMALGEFRGGRLCCVGWGRYELRRHHTAELIATLRPEPPTSESLALLPTSLDRLRELERHFWGPWRRSRAPVLGQVCEARWGPIPACPPEVMREAARIATTKASQLGSRLMRLGSTDSNGSDVSTNAGNDSNSESSETEVHALPRQLGLMSDSPCDDGNLRPFVPTSINGTPCKVEELRESVHQSAALGSVCAEDSWVCAICLGGAAEVGSDNIDLDDAVRPLRLAWRKLPCGHAFHKSCVLPWIRGGKPCPLGRCMVPDAARSGRREMIFPMNSAWKELPQDVVAKDILGPSQPMPGTGHLRAPPHVRPGCVGRLTPIPTFFERFKQGDGLQECCPL